MLLNNFKPLLYFGSSGTFVDVTGATVNVADILEEAQDAYGYAVNSHDIHAGRSFNYTATPASNTYTNEQTTYDWTDIASDSQYYPATGFTIFLGSGNTAVTASDYCLDTPLNLTVTGASCSTSAGGVVTTIRTFENNTGSDVSVSEYGLYLFKNKDTNEVSYPVILLGRKVLSSPIVIPNGEQRTFEYIVRLNNITFTEQN